MPEGTSAEWWPKSSVERDAPVFEVSGGPAEAWSHRVKVLHPETVNSINYRKGN